MCWTTNLKWWVKKTGFLPIGFVVIPNFFLGVDNPLRYGSYGQTHKSPEGLRLILTKSGETARGNLGTGDPDSCLVRCRFFFMSGGLAFPPPKKVFFF